MFTFIVLCAIIYVVEIGLYVSIYVLSPIENHKSFLEVIHNGSESTVCRDRSA